MENSVDSKENEAQNATTSVVEMSETPSGELDESVFDSDSSTEQLSEQDESEFYKAKTVEFSPDSSNTPFLCFLSPGTFLSIQGKVLWGQVLNLVLTFLIIEGPLLCVLTGLFPVPFYIIPVLIILSCWIFGIYRGFKTPLPATAQARPWPQAGLAFLGFWLPFTLCFYLSTGVIYQRTWLGGDMMQPGMQRGDVILVNRLAYVREEPTYGDLVLIEENVQEGDSKHRRTLFGRVIALPGDTVQLSGFRPSVNGKSLQQYHAKADKEVFETPVVTYELPYNVQIPGGDMREPDRWYPVLATNQLLFTQTNEVRLEPDYYYVLEDNRDSKRERMRTVYGYIVNRNEIHGRPQYIIYNNQIEKPLSRYGIAVR